MAVLIVSTHRATIHSVAQPCCCVGRIGERERNATLAPRLHDRRRSGATVPLSVISACPWLFLNQVLTVSATRVNEVQEFAVTFAGVPTMDDDGDAMLVAATANAMIELTFDSANMNWACPHTANLTDTTISVRIRKNSKYRMARRTCTTTFSMPRSYHFIFGVALCVAKSMHVTPLSHFLTSKYTRCPGSHVVSFPRESGRLLSFFRFVVALLGSPQERLLYLKSMFQQVAGGSTLSPWLYLWRALSIVLAGQQLHERRDGGNCLHR